MFGGNALSKEAQRLFIDPNIEPFKGVFDTALETSAVEGQTIIPNLQTSNNAIPIYVPPAQGFQVDDESNRVRDKDPSGG